MKWFWRLLGLILGADHYYSENDYCECGWVMPHYVFAMSWVKRVAVCCPECAKTHLLEHSASERHIVLYKEDK